jgi:hypothetical protein
MFDVIGDDIRCQRATSSACDPRRHDARKFE